MTRIYYVTEFTKLSQHSELISIGMVSDNGRTFYAESNEWDREKAILNNPFLVDHVIPHLLFEDVARYSNADILQAYKIKDCRLQIASKLREWLTQFSTVEFWGDVQSYGWMHLCELFGGAREFQELNPNVSYIPMDIATRLHDFGTDPDISRELFANLNNSRLKEQNGRNALYKAYLVRSCYDEANHNKKTAIEELESIKANLASIYDTHVAHQNEVSFGWYEVGIHNGIDMCRASIERRLPIVWRHDKVKEVTMDRKALLSIRTTMDSLNHVLQSWDAAPKIVEVIDKELQKLGLNPDPNRSPLSQKDTAVFVDQTKGTFNARD
jgi:hypothetical protein